MQSELWLVSDDPDRPGMSDEALVMGLRRGDAPASQYVVRLYAPALYRFVYYQLQDPLLAEDIVAEVMVRMIENIDRFVVCQAPFRAWLFRIARNLISDQYRVHKRCPQVSLEQWLDAEPEREPGECDFRLNSVLDRDQLQSGLLTLTREQREVILLHVIEDWELPEVARLLGRSLASVKGLYYRGIESLRCALVSQKQR
ncbi:MAG TPA: RNA polymerase sigma factor [Chloroflexia bacterium]|nr:RNA polymerase sigma factor [Chloroflexia bacterium]